MAWIIIEANEIHAKATFRTDKLVSKVLPLMKKMIKLMSKDEFIATHQLKRSMEEKVSILIQIDEKAKQIPDNIIRQRRNKCETKDEYLNQLR